MICRRNLQIVLIIMNVHLTTSFIALNKKIIKPKHKMSGLMILTTYAIAS